MLENTNEVASVASNEKKNYVSAESIGSSPEEDFSDIDEQKLRRRIDYRILPLFSVLYLLSFLDRTNIGNAKIEGLPEDLGLVGNQFNMALLIFFVF